MPTSLELEWPISSWKLGPAGRYGISQTLYHFCK